MKFGNWMALGAALLTSPLAGAVSMTYAFASVPQAVQWTTSSGASAFAGYTSRVGTPVGASGTGEQANANQGPVALAEVLQAPSNGNVSYALAVGQAGSHASSAHIVAPIPMTLADSMAGMGYAIATSVSGWKDVLQVSGSGALSVAVGLDASFSELVAPFAGYGGAWTIYQMEIFRRTNGAKVASIVMNLTQGNALSAGFAYSIDAAGLAQSLPDSQVAKATAQGPQHWDLTLNPYLTAGEYDLVSQVQVSTYVTTYARTPAASFAAALQGIDAGPGVTLTSVSGLLADQGGGHYAYMPTSVPEPGTWALLALGLAGLVLRRKPAR